MPDFSDIPDWPPDDWGDFDNPNSQAGGEGGGESLPDWLQDWLDTQGIDYGDMQVKNFNRMDDVSNVRGVRFTDPISALEYIGPGLIDFSDLIYFPDEDLYGVEIEGSP
ncbi:hypothetical protein HC928_12645 [bacterium]|nr:hypothetical protein [bacterium]